MGDRECKLRRSTAAAGSGCIHWRAGWPVRARARGARRAHTEMELRQSAETAPGLFRRALGGNDGLSATPTPRVARRRHNESAILAVVVYPEPRGLGLTPNHPREERRPTTGTSAPQRQRRTCTFAGPRGLLDARLWERGTEYQGQRRRRRAAKPQAARRGPPGHPKKDHTRLAPSTRASHTAATEAERSNMSAHAAEGRAGADTELPGLH